jgi:hypothetical protein
MAEREPPTEYLAPTRPEPEFRDEPTRMEPHSIMAASVGSMVGAMVTSRFGLAGTLLGAALAPVFVMLSTQALGPRIERGFRRGRRGLTMEWGAEREAAPRNWRWAASHPGGFLRRLKRLRRRQIGLAIAAAAIAFAVAMVAITAIESIAGRPLNRIGHHGGSGTTLSPGGGGKPSKVEPITVTAPQQAEPQKTTTTGGTKAPAPKKSPTTSTPTQPTPTEPAPPQTTPLVPSVPAP